jgi:ABC-type maltose transport system permease subunit
MSPKLFYRVLVGLSLGAALAISATGIWPPDSPEEWSVVLEWHGNRGILEYLFSHFPSSGWAWFSLVLVLLLAVAFVVAVQIGMFLFWRFARAGYVALTALFLILTAFDGLVAMTPIDAALHDIALILDGAVIAMSYLPPIATYFEPTKA